MVYLDDLKETGFEVGWFKLLGKHGRAPDGRECPRVNGAKVTHSLFPHPKDKDFSFVTYRLDGQYTTFRATAYNESNKLLTFEVLGDGKQLRLMRTDRFGRSESCDISVEGVQTLELRIHCKGSYESAWAWWIEPCLLK